MTFAVACMLRGEPRFFTGDYDVGKAWFSPVTTGRPDEARAYHEKNVAEIIARTFNALDSVKTRRLFDAWLIIELPEAWT